MEDGFKSHVVITETLHIATYIVIELQSDPKSAHC